MNKKNLLNSYSKKIYSQFGEDGILLEILDRLGKENLDKWCVEFGARDGISDSNTYNLIKNHNYTAVLIEGDEIYYKKLCKNFQNDSVIKINKYVNFSGENKLDNILLNTKISKNFDFLSIDIDGCDYHVLNSLIEYRPKIICIEFNHFIPNSVEFIQKKNFNIKQGSSAKSLVKLGATKGYRLIASSFSNLFFIEKSYFNLVSKDEILIDDLIDDSEIKNYIFCGYDGSLHTSNPLKLGWHKIEIQNKKIQVLPSYIRHFPDDYNIFQKIIFLIFREILDPGRVLRKFFKKKK